ncbi:MAG TPA: hypothetical protein VFA17_10450 [Thermoplasmata archaeon]|jgi:hypothetical protein|nr:hypothetical protein [Thermoplasmata archaeon]
MARVLLALLSTLAAILLLSLGGSYAYSNVAWHVEWSYDIDVVAPVGVTWILWIPHPGVSMPWTTTGSVAVVGTLPTSYGTRINITGTGSGGVRFSNSTTVVGIDPWSGIPRELSLSGGEGGSTTERYRIWRHSSDPSANLTLSGGLRDALRTPQESWTCVGSGFAGHPEEGWSALPFQVGRCTQAFASLPRLIPLALIALGSVLAGVSAAAWRRPPAHPS